MIPFYSAIPCCYSIYHAGLQMKPDCEELPITVKAAVILGSTDLQGKAYLTCMAQHNGECGCITCEEPGVAVKQGKGHTRCYPYRTPTEAASKRTREFFKEWYLWTQRK